MDDYFGFYKDNNPYEEWEPVQLEDRSVIEPFYYTRHVIRCTSSGFCERWRSTEALQTLYSLDTSGIRGARSYKRVSPFPGDGHGYGDYHYMEIFELEFLRWR